MSFPEKATKFKDGEFVAPEHSDNALKVLRKKLSSSIGKTSIKPPDRIKKMRDVYNYTTKKNKDFVDYFIYPSKDEIEAIVSISEWMFAGDNIDTDDVANAADSISNQLGLIKKHEDLSSEEYEVLYELETKLLKLMENITKEAKTGTIHMNTTAKDVVLRNVVKYDYGDFSYNDSVEKGIEELKKRF